MKEFFKELLYEKYKLFYGGAIGGLVPGAFFLLDVPAVAPPLLIWFYILKLTGAITIAFCSGIAAAFASDAYKWAKGKGKKIKLFNRKNQKDGTNEKAA